MTELKHHLDKGIEVYNRRYSVDPTLEPNIKTGRIFNPKEYWQTNTSHGAFKDNPKEFQKKVLSFLSKYI